MSLIPESATKKFGDKLAEKQSETPEGYVEDICYQCGEMKQVRIGNNCCDDCNEEMNQVDFSPEEIKATEEQSIKEQYIEQPIIAEKTEEKQSEPKKKRKPKKDNELEKLKKETNETINKDIEIFGEEKIERLVEKNEEPEENLFPDEEPSSSSKIKQLAQDTDLTVEEIRKLTDQKKIELKGLISDDGAMFIVAKELGVELTPEKPKKKKKTPIATPKEKIVKEYDLTSHPILALIWGGDGTSKSEQIMKFVDEKGRRALIFDPENKLLTIAKKLNFPMENIISSGIYNQEYEIDGPTTLQELRNELNKIKTMFREKKEKISFSAIGLDGISDLRPFAEKEWLEEHPGRIKANTEGDLKEINDKVREITVILLNMGRAERINVFFTSQLSPKYLNKKIVGDKPQCKEWIWYNIDHKFKLYVENNRFYAFCEKSYYDPFFTIDLTDFTHKEIPSLFNILQDPILIEKYKLKEKSEEKIV